MGEGWSINGDLHLPAHAKKVNMLVELEHYRVRLRILSSYPID